MSNHGPVAGAVGDGEELASVGAFSEDFLKGLEEEPFWERDLAAGCGAVAADAGDDDLLGGGREGAVGEGFKLSRGLGAAEVAFNAADFVEVGHASAGVSKIQRIDHREHRGHRGGGIQRRDSIYLPRDMVPRRRSSLAHDSGCMETERVTAVRPLPEPSFRPDPLRGPPWDFLAVMI